MASKEKDEKSVAYKQPNALRRYINETIGELRKVTWPDREETLRSTMVVVATSLFLAGVLAGFDWLWGSRTSAFLFTEG